MKSRRGSGKNHRGGGGRSPRARPALPDKLEALPYVGPQMVETFRRIGVYSPADLEGRSGEDLYAAFQRCHGEPPQHSMLYVLRAVVHFVKTGERRDWRQFMDVGHKQARRHGSRRHV